MFRSTCSLTRWIRRMSRPSPTAVGSTSVSIPAARTRWSFATRAGDAALLVPPGLAPTVVEVRERLLPEDEDVLMGQRAPEALRLDRATNGLDGRHAPLYHETAAPFNPEPRDCGK